MHAPRWVRASRGSALADTAPPGSYLPSTRRHRLSGGQNVLRCVRIAVMLLAAVGTRPLAAAQRQVLQDLPTLETPLAGRIEAPYRPELPPIPLAFVLEHPTELAEGRPLKRAGQSVVLAHAPHVQVLDRDHVEPSNQIGGGFMEVVRPGIRDPRVKPGDLLALDAPTLGPLLLPGQVALGVGQLPL